MKKMSDYSEIYNAIPKIFKSKVQENSLYHYTSITGFLLMMKDIKERKCYLFPGNMRYQNDAHELIEGISFIADICKDKIAENILNAIKKSIKNLNNNIYIACFSSNGNLLEQWKYYGKDCGLSIEFNFSECEGFWQKNIEIGEEQNIKEYTLIKTLESKDELFFDNKDYGFDFSENNIFNCVSSKELTRNGISLNPIKVLYEKNEKVDIIKNLIIDNREQIMDELKLANSPMNINDYINCVISAFIPICKNRFFSHEQESRLLFYPIDGTEILYREKSNRILPYIKCTVVNKDSKKYPIKSITVGPGVNQNLVFNSVISILEGVDNEKFISENDCSVVLQSEKYYTNINDIIRNTMYQEISCLINNNGEKMIVYHSVGNILVYKSQIPFRD